jgi:rhodanese-related sulfurtransferase
MNRNLILKITALFALGFVLGLGANLLRSPDWGGIPWVTDWSETLEAKADALGLTLVSLEEADQWARDGSRLFLDARPAKEYQAGHIPGAMSLPYLQLDTAFPDIQLFLAPELPVVCYCSGEDCEDSLLLGEFLIQQGYTNIFLFEGGMNQWRDAGLAEEGV